MVIVEPHQIVMFAIFAPIIVSITSHIISKIPKAGAQLAKVVCIVTAYIVFFSILSLVPSVSSSPIQSEFFHLPLVVTTANLEIYVDFLSLLPALLCSLFGALALTFTVQYLSPKNKAYTISDGFNRLYSVSLLMVGAINGALFSSNLIGLLLFWELVSVCLYAIISFWYSKKNCVQSAFKCLIMTHIGSLALFIASIVLFFTSGTLNMIELGNGVFTNTVAIIVFPLLLVALLPKAVQIPFHTWLPDATVAPTSTMILFLVGDLAGIYLLIRFFSQVFQPFLTNLPIIPFAVLFGNINIWSFIISVIGVITLLSAAINAITENELKRILAYSVISELGYSVMVIGFATSLGTVAGLFYLTSHVFVAGVLFLCAGAVIYATGKSNIDELGGLYRYIPITASCCALSVLAIGGLPLLSEFTGKYLIIHSTLEIASPFFLAATVLGGVFHLAIAIRLLYSVFLTRGSNLGIDPNTKEPPITMLAPMILMSAVVIFLGMLPMPLLDTFIIPGIRQLGFAANIIEPFGIIHPALGFWTPLVIAISMLVLGSMLILTVTYTTKRKHREQSSEDAFKPVLCGEDENEIYEVPSSFFYHTFTQVLKLENLRHRLSVDRFYYFLLSKLSKGCQKLLALDIHQNFTPAFMSFIIGAIILILIVVLGV
ncbi:MAG: hypothetical protein IAX21_10310 [Candidatus Bathyarchaeota archaeon]|nr:MAG: proton-conducting transporter membrane subunit [Candidatus Bathyarchaeum tardum]WNZ29014.1 MAG: hypothetical protein IAX21_10310 [Candidatus Bathyarchaeota archaeon]